MKEHIKEAAEKLGIEFCEEKTGDWHSATIKYSQETEIPDFIKADANMMLVTALVNEIVRIGDVKAIYLDEAEQRMYIR